MPYARRTYRKYPVRRPRRYSRYPKRRRFSRKKFYKYSSKQKTVVRAPVNARETFVKLPWQVTSSPSLAGGASQTFAYLGNSLAPFGTYGSSIPASGSIWASGVSEYAAFYERYRVLGSSISIRMVTTATNNLIRCVLIPVMVGGPESAGVGSVNDRIIELDALTFDQLSVQPYAQSKMIGLATGSNAMIYFKMFRKTKYMGAVKDVKDNSIFQAEMPQTDGSGGSIITNGDSAWFYYLRFFNVSAASQVIDIQTRMKFYTQLSGRSNWVPIAVPA